MTDLTYDPMHASLPQSVDVVSAPRLRWSALLGGAIAALGVWVLLYTFGLAMGLSTIDPNEPESLRGSGTFTGVWGLISPIIALFIGGLVASRAASVLTRGVGLMHGLIVWALTTIAGAWIFLNVFSAVVGGAFSVGQTAVGAGGALLGAALSGAGDLGEVARGFGLDANDAIAPINQQLRAEGRPEITPEQVQAAAREALDSAVRQGRIDRETLIGALDRGTALDRADAEALAGRIETQFLAAQERAKASMGRARETVETSTLKVADATGKALWGVFGSMLLGLLAALGGALFGASTRVHVWAEQAQQKARERRPLLRQQPAHSTT